MATDMEQLGDRFNMPMSGDVMRDTGVSSSYPPSLAYILRQRNKIVIQCKHSNAPTS